MKVRTLLYFYGWRLRAHPFQELLAGSGIAVGVALLFAVQVANTSITGSVEQLFRGLTGSAQIQISSGDERGLSATTLDAVEAIDGVEVAAPIIERRAILVGPKGRHLVELIGVEPSAAELGGSATRNFSSTGLLLPREGIVLPDEIAKAIGVSATDSVTLQLAGRARRVEVSATTGEAQIGIAAGSPLAAARLDYAQQLAGMEGRVSSIFVRADPGRERTVRAALRRLGRGRLDVGPADSTVRRLESATEANRQSTALFSVISAVVGVLFAFNAMLLTVPDRRRFVAELRTQGATARQVVAVVGFQALALGVAASVGGLVLGDVLSRTVFDSVPGYLASVFPIGTQRVVPLSAILLASGVGVAAALLAAGRPLLDAFSRGNIEAAYEDDGEPGEGIGVRARAVLLCIAVALLIATAIAVSIASSTAIVGIVVLIVATLLAMPAVFAGCTRGGIAVADRLDLGRLMIAIMSARATATRSVAVAAIAAVAVLGNVAVGGGREDLIRGLNAGFAEQLNSADLWVTAAGRVVFADSFRVEPDAVERLRRAPGISAVRINQGGFFDTGSRRIMLLARSSGSTAIVPPSQTFHGDARRAAAQIRSGGFAAVSDAVARSRGLAIGDSFALPTPTGPLRLRVAAIVTNLSWAPGTIVMNADDYQRAWQTNDPSAIEIDLKPGMSAAAAKRVVASALEPATAALDIQTTAEQQADTDGVLREGLSQLNQIATLLLIASALALAAAMSAAVWERRKLLAAYKLEGVKRHQLSLMLLLEAATVLAIGCGLGAAAGVYGHLLLNRWLELSTGFPAPFSVQLGQAAARISIVVVLSLAIVSVPGYLAVRVPPRLRFQESR